MKRKLAVEILYKSLVAYGRNPRHRKDTKAYYKLFGFCVGHTGKMTDLFSISTCCRCNENCKARMNNPEMICSKCFANAMCDSYGTKFVNKLRWNSELLSTYIFPVDVLPVIKTPSNYFRFESFGDLINETQVINYFNMARVNPSVKCALWTKNPWIIKSAIDNYGTVKPANLTIMGSSYYLNKPMTEYYKQFDFIDHVFTVFTPEYVADNHIDITCGARSCATCGRCYSGMKSEYEINELLK